MNQKGVDVNEPNRFLYLNLIGLMERLMNRTDAQFKLRLPQELKDWIESQAKSNYHSMQAEVLGIIAEAKRKSEQSKQIAA